jgi:hypothetical protein
MCLLGGCSDFAKKFGLENVNCCNSCHDDDDEGYMSLSEKNFEDGWYCVCCAMLIAYDEMEKKGG